jgi:uncharacterized small protein (TIGR04563 family)
MKSEMLHVNLGLQISEELKAEAIRLDRSASWLMRKAWELAKERISDLPGSPPTNQRRFA